MHFKKHLAGLSLVSLALLASSCANDEAETLQASSKNAISFSCYTCKPGSRAASTSSTSFAKFGVLASHTGTTGWASTAQNKRIPNFMYNQEVSKNVSAWDYTPQKYWPGSGDKVSFYAYAPYTAAPAAVASGASGVIALSGKDVAGEPWLKYEVGSDISKHQDLMYAKAMDKTSAGGAVNLEFKHALSQVYFNAVAWEGEELGDASCSVTINSVTLKTKRKSATLNLSTGAWSSPVDNASQVAYTLSTANGLLKNNTFTGGESKTNRLMANGDYIMMLPNLGTSDEYEVSVDYTVTADGDTEKQVKTAKISPKFQPGKSYAITIHIDMSEYGGYIAFTATCGDWGAISGVDVSLGN